MKPEDKFGNEIYTHVYDEPTYNDSQMKQPRELEGGYYLEVNLSWGQKKREMERLADACGVEVDIEE